jgi:hypothetical protein
LPSEQFEGEPDRMPENSTADAPSRDSDPTYGAHLWDDCEADLQPRYDAEPRMPVADNYGAEQVQPSDEQDDPNQRRTLLLAVARSLREAGAVLVSMSQDMERLAGEVAQPVNDATYGTDEYRD